MDDIRTLLGKMVILADGAMGTELYRRGFFVNRSYDLLNLEEPDVVSEVHRDYVNSGAQIVETNTFGASRHHLSKWGAGERVREVNLAAVKLARKAAADCAWVAGSMGPSGLMPPPFGKEHADTILEVFREQAVALKEGGVDLILLETFKNIQEAQLAVKAVRDVAPDIVLGLQFTFTQVYGGGYKDVAPDHCAMLADDLPIDFLGANCAGPRELIDVLAVYRNLTDKPLAVMANAGLPQDVDGRTVYMATPDYMGEYAMRFVEAGATVIGGCCGTGPAAIKKMAHYLSGQMAPVTEKPRVEVKKKAGVEPLEPAPIDQCSRFGANLGKKFQISVELALPKGLDPSKPLNGAKMLADSGIDIVNIPDGPRALARTSPISLAVMLKERGMESIVHYCCRDRNLLGMQMDLIGAHMLGVHNILIITGDPPKMGDAPEATGVFDVDSIGLTRLASNLNRGLDISGNSLEGVTRLVLGVGCEPGTENLEREVDRFGKKVAAGARFVFSQPVYDSTWLYRFFDATDEVDKIPFFVGILPLASQRNAEFLHNEVPGMQIPEEIMERISAPKTKEKQREVGMQIAREALEELKQHPRVTGAYIYPPFGMYESVLDIVKGIV